MTTIAELSAAALARSVAPADVRGSRPRFTPQRSDEPSGLPSSATRLWPPLAMKRSAASEPVVRQVVSPAPHRSEPAEDLIALALGAELAVPGLLLDYIRFGVASALFGSGALAAAVLAHVDVDSLAPRVLCQLVVEVCSPAERRTLLDALLNRIALATEPSTSLCACTAIAVEGVAVDDALRVTLGEALTKLTAGGVADPDRRRLAQTLVQLQPSEERLAVPILPVPAVSAKRPWPGLSEHLRQPTCPDALLLVESLVRP